MIQRGWHERALIAFMDHRGHFFESEVTALKTMADAGWTRERAAEILLEAIKTGVNPIARVRNLIAREQNQYPPQGRYQRPQQGPPVHPWGGTFSDLSAAQGKVQVDLDEAVVESLREYMRHIRLS